MPAPPIHTLVLPDRRARATSPRPTRRDSTIASREPAYEFEADGRLFRDSDQVLPVIANRWQQGDVIQILFITDRDYDSVVISLS